MQVRQEPEPGLLWSKSVSSYFLGGVEKGFEWLELAYSGKDIPGVELIHCHPALDGIGDDARHLDLLKRLGVDKTAQTK